jgi:hypothetical protein
VVPPSTSASTLIDFNGIGSVGDPAPAITAGGVTVTFSNLEIGEVLSSTNGFTGDGPNQVILGDRSVFNGQFLTALGGRFAFLRAPGFVRTILFSAAVTDVSYVRGRH